MTATASLALPDCAFLAASMRRFVTPLIADTTATQLRPFAPSAMICAVLAIHNASPTDVPPNFITCNCAFMFSGRLPGN